MSIYLGLRAGIGHRFWCTCYLKIFQSSNLLQIYQHPFRTLSAWQIFGLVVQKFDHLIGNMAVNFPFA